MEASAFIVIKDVSMLFVHVINRGAFHFYCIKGLLGPGLTKEESVFV